MSRPNLLLALFFESAADRARGRDAFVDHFMGGFRLRVELDTCQDYP